MLHPVERLVSGSFSSARACRTPCVEQIRRCGNAAQRRNSLPGGAPGAAGAVEAFVKLKHCLNDIAVRSDRLRDAGAVIRMFLDDIILLFRQFAGFVKNRPRRPDLAQAVEKALLVEDGEIAL